MQRPPRGTAADALRMSTITPGSPVPPPRRRRPRRGALALTLAGLVGLTLLGAALSPLGLLDGGHGPRFGVARFNHDVALTDGLRTRLTKVYDSSVPARQYGQLIGDLEDQGTNAAGQQVGDLTPVAAAAFARPIAEYKRYAARWLRRVRADAARLTAALNGPSRRAAQSAWERGWSDYLHLGAVYGLFGTLDQAIDGMPGVLPQGTASPRFSGFHRLEMGLWHGAPLASLRPWSRLLTRDVGRLQAALPGVRITPLDYATRAHEILEDAQRDLLSGMDVPWSQQGVLGTAAGLAATREVIRTLGPLLDGRDNTEGAVSNQLRLLGTVLQRIRRAHGGAYPALDALTRTQRELLDGTLAGVLNQLQAVPGTLETANVEQIPAIGGRQR